MKKHAALLASLALILSHSVFSRDLADIARSGVLLVGTTGDYPPLTMRNRQGVYEGFAIDMATLLQTHLSKTVGKKLRLECVWTHWPDLHEDMKQGRFDIAMGGITRTEDREQAFLLSNNVMPSGKVALMRKELAAPYLSLNNQALLNKLNTSGLHLVINPGGTNQRFAMQHLPDMRFTLTADNREPFLMLRDHQADIMITDKVEALYQSQHNPSLIVINEAMFSWTVSHKVYMMQKSSKALHKEVNRWLQQTDIQKVTEKWF